VHLVVVLLTMLILPLGCVAWGLRSGGDLLALTGQWFLFWGAGVRLAIAGLRQVFAPRLTLEGIFGLQEPRAWPLVQELGFWNTSIGLLCMVSLVQPGWRLPLAFASGLFYGLAGLKHVTASDRSFEANTAMVSDLAIAVVLLGYALLTLRTGRA
jgi:hypothetical protein